MGDVVFLLLRRLRLPLVTLIAVYAVSVAGLAVIPGIDGDGRPFRMGLFEAFYVVSYTATTIGYGELPYPFTGGQRMWVTFSIYLSVIGWAFTLTSLVALVQDATFRAALGHSLSVRRIRRLNDPFYLICGYGQTGRSIAHALDRLGCRVVIVENDEQRAARIVLEDYEEPPAVLVADARLPEALRDAGVQRPLCRAVLALAADDETNEAIAIGARILRPDCFVLSLVRSRQAADNLEAYGGVHAIDPFHQFAVNVQLDLRAPEVLQLEEWLTAVPGSERPEPVRLPRGHWVLCGYGRFGSTLAAGLDAAGQTWCAIDPRAQEDDARVLRSSNTEQGLRDAGIERAVALVAGTDEDSTNLALVRLARRLNPELLIVVRQNRSTSRSLFDAARVRLKYVQSDVMTHELLQVLTSPLLNRFLLQVRMQGAALACRAREALEPMFGRRVPHLWTFDCDPAQPGLGHALSATTPPLTIGELLRDPRDPRVELRALPLLLAGRDGDVVLPEPQTRLRPYDRILFAGAAGVQSVQRGFVLDPSPIEFVRTGVEPPRSWIFRRLLARRAVASDQGADR